MLQHNIILTYIQQSSRMTAVVGMVLMVWCSVLSAQTNNANNALMDNTGFIRNTGTIRISGITRGNTNANAFVDNRGGTMRFGGTTFLAQDTLLGRAEFVMNNPELRQFVPQITYSVIQMTGASIKALDSVGHRRNLVSLDSLMTDGAAEIAMGQQYEIIARGHVQHDGFINRAFTHGKVQMTNRVNETNSHNVSGRGEFKRLELNNLSGADVVSGGGFTVRNQLDLTQGEFRNSTANNFRVGDNAQIIRNVAGSLRSEPNFDGTVNVRYVGTGSVIVGGEIPSLTPGAAGRLQDLEVLNTGGVTIQKTMTVNRSMTVASKIFTESQNRIDTLVYTARNNPVYLNDTAEVIGTMRRINLAVGDSSLNLFHNQFTHVRFPTVASQGAVRVLSMRVLPNATPIPESNPDSRNKVRRAFDVRAFDQQGGSVTTGFAPEIGYAWRRRTIDETNQRNISRIQLQYFDELRSAWASAGATGLTQVSTSGNWAYGASRNVQTLGFMALGDDSRIPAQLSVRVLLEGAYNWGRSAQDTMMMTTKLRQDGLIPRRPVNTYPYNLDTNLTSSFSNQFPVPSISEDIVDWVLIELRRTITPDSNAIYKIAFLRRDGFVVDIDGLTPLRVNASGSFYVVVHHRNHLAMMSDLRYSMTPDLVQNVEMLRVTDVLGGRNVMKEIERINGVGVWVMPGGDINGDGVVDNSDINYRVSALTPWQQVFRDLEYNLRDADMNGYISTGDLNLSWNNRGRSTNVLRR